METDYGYGIDWKTVVWKFGGMRVTDEGVLEQMKLSRKYYNMLVEAENARRMASWGGDKPPPAPHEDCICDACKSDAPPDPPHEFCKCKKCKDHWAGVKAALRKVPPIDIKPIRAQIVSDGLYWGSYLTIEQAFKAAWTTTRAQKKVKFRSWRQGDVIAVQVMKSRREAGTLDRLFQIEKMHDPRKGRRARNGKGRHTVRVRIGSDEKRRPIFSAPIRIELHRPFPPLAEVTWIHVRRKYCADREIWSVAFTLTFPAKSPTAVPEGTVAVDVGWREFADSSWRIAYARDMHGNVYEFRLPKTWSERVTRADRIRSHRDDNLNGLKAQDKRFALTKSCRGVVRKAEKEGWENEPALAAWIARDTHLWRYEAGCRRRSQSGRRAALTEWCSALAKSYAHVVVKDTDHKLLKEKKDLPKKARKQGHHAAPGETIECLRRFFGDSRMYVVEAANTTATCIKCGHVGEYGAELMLTCENCGAVEDRDNVSTENMLALYRAGEARPPKARKKTARFAKRHKPKDPKDPK